MNSRVRVVAQKTKEQISFNMSRVRNKDTALENILYDELNRRGFLSFTQNEKTVFGKPDFVFSAKKLAVFCDSEFWHGYDWRQTNNEIKSNREFWIPKIEKTIERDKTVNERLASEGWTVLRFWGKQIKDNVTSCADDIEAVLRTPIQAPLRTIDLCAGIGGLRRGFERVGGFTNVLSSEIDKWACMTYEHLYGENPCNDLTTEDFKRKVESTPYDILLAGFPCQTFSRVGLEEGFENEEKGQIFFHIADIVSRTRPCALFLENVDHLITHDKGETFRRIIDILESQLQYKVIGVSTNSDKGLSYAPSTFIRNSKDFGVPQNRPRTYIIGFDRERFTPDQLAKLPMEPPKNRATQLYNDLNDILEREIEPKYYMASGYFETLIKHRERQERKGYGFGYRIVNEPDNPNPIANTLLATGGSGKERNLIFDPREGIAGRIIKTKKTPLNDKGIRVMTPTEWGKLQGFVNYAFIGDNGKDTFSFPEQTPDAQKYKQFGNAVTIPVIEEMAKFLIECFDILNTAEDMNCRR